VQRSILIGAFVALGVIALMLKIMVSSSVYTAKEGVDTESELVSALAASGFALVSTVVLTNTDAYKAYILKHDTCPDGLLAVVPVIRNAETVGLSALFTGNIEYIVQGERYQSFPAAPVWFASVQNRLGWQSQGLTPIGVVEKGSCRLSDRLTQS